MKRPIEPSDIRKGDLIRKEYGVEVGHGELALEYRATSDAHGKGGPGTHFLLDRPEPAVELPTEGLHLGWLTHDGQADLLVFSFNRPGHVEDASYGSVSRPTVEAFTPATAVPTAALDRLRAYCENPLYDQRAIKRQVGKFLTAVDEANRA